MPYIPPRQGLNASTPATPYKRLSRLAARWPSTLLPTDLPAKARLLTSQTSAMFVVSGITPVHVKFLNALMESRWVIKEQDAQIFNKFFCTHLSIRDLMEMWYTAPDGRKQEIWYF